MIIFAVKGKRELFGPRESDVLQYDNVPSASRAHSTQKPVDLLRLLIEKSTLPEEIVLDPFAGTGSTGLACKDTLRHKGDGKERSYLLMELNREFHRAGLQGGLAKQNRLWQNIPLVQNPVPAKKRLVVRSHRYSRARSDQTLSLDLKIPL
jgi:DNA modification methylase